MEKISTIQETICLISLAYGNFEYFEIGCIEDLKEAYADFDNRIAHDTDIELQYIDGVLSGSSIDNFEDIIALADRTQEDFEVIRDIFNATLDLKETERILQEYNYIYILADNKEYAFINYLSELGFFEGVPEHLESYLDYKKLMRDYEIEGLNIYEVDYTDFLFIY